MNPGTFFDNFGMLADVPDGVSKLRELILQLAVQGKLVPQDENDEPASVLLERIKAEKEMLVKDGSIKKSKPLAKIQTDEILFKLPLGWQWSRLGDYTFIIMGQSPESKYYNKGRIGLPFYQGKTEFGKLYPTPSNWCEVPKKIAKQNDILISVRAPVGPTNICQEDSCIGRGLTALRNLSGSNHFHLLYTLRAFESQLAEMGVGSTFTAISKTHLDTFLIPVPPLEEQKRIVSKVDQLMNLCDELEARQKKKHEARTRLNSAALSKLTSAPDGFIKNWQSIHDNFDLLYDAPEIVGELRKAILQLAVMGKLVAQDESDEPATELLKRVITKKGNLKPNKHKIEMLLPSIQPDEIPYNSPIGWEWVKLSEITERIHYGFTASADHSSTAVKLLRITDIQNNQVNWNTVPGCQINDTEIPKYELHQNDILIARTGGTIGKTFLVEEIPSKAVFASYLIRVIPSPELLARYLKLFLESPFYWEQIRANSAGTGQPNVNGVALSNLIAPLPPLAEQRRIVARVDQLMTLCDELEAKLAQSQTDGAGLMEAVVGEMVGMQS